MSEPQGQEPESVDDVLAAIDNFDWSQPIGHDWNPCFFIEDGVPCGRAKRWAGHEVGHDHPHYSLREMIEAALERERAELKAKNAEIEALRADLDRSGQCEYCGPRGESHRAAAMDREDPRP